MRTYHNWHIVTYSPWPFYVSIILFSIPLALVAFFKGILFSLFFFYFSLFLLIYVIFIWFSDVIVESSGEGYHTEGVQQSLSYSMLLFIFSEVMFFFGFFWSFFWLGFAPSIELNLTWPPNALQDLIFDPFEIPLLNTIILLTSGATITIAHFYLKEGEFFLAKISIIATLLLASLFLLIQLFEYFSAPFDISDGAYASVFYICTGFHGFHVIIGAIFISVILRRINDHNFSRMHHFGFEAGAWYWHFVDVVWLFLYVLIYFWGSDLTHLEYKTLALGIYETFLNTNTKVTGNTIYNFAPRSLKVEIFKSIDLERFYLRSLKK